MASTSYEDEKTAENSEESRSESCIVVTSSPPFWKAIAEKVIVTLSSFTSQNLGHYTQTRKAIGSGFAGRLDFGIRGDFLALLAFSSSFASDKLLLDLVGM